MSAWMTSDAHMTAILQLAASEGLITWHMAPDMGKQMKHENELSLQARYHDDVTPMEELDFEFDPVEAPLDEMVVISACKSWQYQTCEYTGCDQAPGWKLVESLVDHLCIEFGLDPEDPLRRVLDEHTQRGWRLDTVQQAIKEQSR